MNLLLPLAFLLLSFKEAAGQGCDTGAYVYKSHIWNRGYVAKLYLDQSWLAQQTSDWTLAITFNDEVEEFKVWDADIINPATKNNYVNNVTSVEVMNKCYNPILYSCQFLELSFMIRYPDCPEPCPDYDIIAVTETVTYLDGASANMTYCPILSGQPTTPASSG
eukprot:GFUD01037520.1.p1 GENE.GFUD01037520.1~~GFUD01037520.1.p1  ORF type:complete len:186 (-),score=43.30 GFUD01037520.1:181-672(-)